MAPRDLVPGGDYAEGISRALEGSRVLLLVFSRSTASSVHCLREVELAMRYELRILPLRIDDAPIVGGYEYRLATIQWLDAKPGSSRTSLRSRPGRLTERP